MKPEILNQKIELLNFTKKSGIELYIKREDLLHRVVSGNKFRKLKYNLIEARKQNKNTLLTFGGAFSNHISAVAGAGKEFGFHTIGVIRGEELAEKWEQNPTLSEAVQNGMTLHFVSREAYREKSSENFLEQLKTQFGDFYMLPEGGTNELAIKGCEEILTEADSHFTHICTAVGTGGTLAGIVKSAQPQQKIIGFSALKGVFLSDICTFVSGKNWEINTDFHFGGYGKITDELIAFLNDFYEKTTIPLDPVYNGKMMFGILKLIENGYFEENAKVLVIHTGGLQGIKGINTILRTKNKEWLHYEL